MATASDAADDSTVPWEYVDATHLTGDLYFINKFARKWWLSTSALCFLFPPGGLFCLFYMLVCGIHREGDNVELEMRDVEAAE